MKDKRNTLKLSAIDIIYLVGSGALIFIVVKYGGVSSTPPYFVIPFLALFWIVEIWKAVSDIANIIREEQQTTSQGNSRKRMVRRVLIWLIPLLFKALLTGSILWRLKVLSQLAGFST